MTARLIARTGKVRGLDQPVSELLNVGSGRGNQLRIDSRTVSRRHAQIVKSGTEYFVEDLGSRNGTFLNGQRVKRFPIRHLDVLSIGPDVDLIFLEGGVAILPIERRASLRATIAWTDGPLTGRVEEVAADRGLLLGRGGEMEGLGAISRRHAVLTIRDDRVTIEDLGSANGTWVNRVSIRAVTQLADGDEVSLANLVGFRVSILRTSAGTDDEEGGMDLQETFAVDRPASRREPVLELPRSWLASAPAESAPRVVPSPAPVANTDTAVPPAPVVPAPVVDDATRAAPREPAIAPKVVVPLRTVPEGIQESFPGDATTAAPREPGVAPRFDPPALPMDVEPSTFAQPRDPAGGVPEGVAARARAARDAVGATDAAPIEARPVDSALPAARPSPAPSVPGSGRISGLRLDGSQDVLLNRGTFLIGRHPECDVYIDSRDVGRRHAQLHVRDDRVTVEDLGTANGTFVNDETVTGETEVPDGSHLRFATLEFTVTYCRSEGQTP